MKDATQMDLEPGPNASKNLFNSILIYGATGTGKTFEIGPIALWVYQRTGKKTRLLCTDGGGWGSIQAYVDAGLIEPLNLSSEPDALLRIWQASQGYWPKPGSPSSWQKIPEQRDWKDVGMVAVEGLTSIADMLMAELIQDGRKVSQDVVGGYSVTDPVTKEKFNFGQPGQSHYGVVHRQLLDIMRNFGGLMSHGIQEVLFTALESRGEDALTKQMVLGPMTVGKALTGVLPHRVGDCIHLDLVAVPTADKKSTIEKHRAYYTNHVDPDIGRAWPAKMRLGADEALAIRSHPKLKNGYLDLELTGGVEREGITELFRWRESQKTEAAGKLRMLMSRGREERESNAQNAQNADAQNAVEPGSERGPEGFVQVASGIAIQRPSTPEPRSAVEMEAERERERPLKRPPGSATTGS